MTTRQTWAIIVGGFILLLLLIVGGYTYGIVKSVEEVLKSPASTSQFDIDVDMMLEMSEDGELQLKYIHFNRIQGEINSKILDLILLGANK